MLEMNEIGRISDGQYKAFCSIWGSRTSVYINISDPDTELGKCLPAINAKLRILDGRKADLFRTLREDGDDIVMLAEEWITSSDPLEDELGEYYLTNREEKVRLPLDPKEMCDGLTVEGVTVMYTAEDDILVYIFIYCGVDYFAGHCIEAVIKSDDSFSSNGLAG